MLEALNDLNSHFPCYWSTLLEDELGPTDTAADVLAKKIGWHSLVELLRQSVYGCFAGYEDVNDADFLERIPQCVRPSAVSPSNVAAHPPAR